MIAVTVKHIIVSEEGFVLLLKGVEDPRTLPIVIGAPEAQSIAVALSSMEVPRPLTHDLLRNILQSMDINLSKIQITALKNGTFFAELVLSTPTGEIKADSRPSDAVALALRAGCPILVNPAVMEEAGCTLDEELIGHESADPNRKSSAPRSSIDVLNRKLKHAIQQEKYEDAAIIRDKIADLTNKQNHN